MDTKPKTANSDTAEDMKGDSGRSSPDTDKVVLEYLPPGCYPLPVEAFQVQIKHNGALFLEIWAMPGDSVLAIKTAIGAKIGVRDTRRFHVILATGRRLDEIEKLTGAGEESSLLLYLDIKPDRTRRTVHGPPPSPPLPPIPNPPNSIEIFIKLLDGNSGSYLYLRTDSILAVMATIKAITGTDQNRQRLLFGGRQLEQAYRLVDYGIESEQTLNLCLRLLGGSNC